MDFLELRRDTETCTQMFAAAPFIIVKRKKPQEPSKEEGLEGVGFVIRSEIPVLFVPFNQHPNTLRPWQRS